MQETINFVKYSIDELFECLESIDDRKYPDRANEIVDRILAQSQYSKDDLLTLYQEDNLLSMLSLVSVLACDQHHINAQVHEKLKRIMAQVS
jgi:hypothetical protein